MTLFYGLLAVLLGIVGGYFAATRKPKNRYLATAEYWVYLPTKEMPDQNDLMDRTIGRNPYRFKGQDPIGTKEGLIFSDVRLHIALALRDKNPSAFRPDLFAGNEDLTADMLDSLAKSESFVKVRFVSEDRLKDERHLQFLPHVVDALAELGNSDLIYDFSGDKLLTRPELVAILSAKPDVSGPDVHVSIKWHQEADAGYAETKGMIKVGRKEFRTPSTPFDQRVLVISIMEDAIRNAWSSADLPTSIELTAFGDQFRVVFESTSTKFTKVRIQRLRTA